MLLYYNIIACSADIEIDVFSGYGGSYYPPAIARPEVIVMNQPVNYMPLPGGQMMMPQPQLQPQPYGAMGMANTTGYYQQQQGYQYQQYQHINNPPYPRW